MAITKKSPNTILLDQRKPFFVSSTTGNGEGAVTVATYPGMIVSEFSSSNVMKFKPHDVAGGLPHEIIVAMENAMMGKSITDPYAIGDLLYAVKLLPGDRFWAIIPDGTNITTNGTILQSAGTGKFQAHVTATGYGLVKTLEITDGAVTGDNFIMVQVIEPIAPAP